MCASLTCSGGERGNISVSKKIIDSPKFKKKYYNIKPWEISLSSSGELVKFSEEELDSFVSIKIIDTSKFK